MAAAELYDASSGRWTPTASMVVGRVGHMATLLLDGRLLVAGGDMSGGGEGSRGPGDIASAELDHP